jgi:cytidylate kinase
VLLDNGSSLEDAGKAEAAARGLALRDFDETRLRGADMGEAASVVAAIPQVRAALMEWQRRFASRPEGAVLDGRDIGTVICPDAQVKLFVTASPETRAQRRALELRGRGENVDFADVLADIRRRDERDSGRSSAPLVAAPDAVMLDTTVMDVEAAVRAAIAATNARAG